MAVKGEVKQSDKIAIATLKGYLSDGLTLAEMGDIEGVSKQAMSGRLKKHGLQTTRTNNKKVKDESQVKSSEVKSTSLKPPVKVDKRKKIKQPQIPLLDGPQDPDDSDPDPDEIKFDIPQQLKEMVKCSEYVCDHIEKASFGDAIKFYEKTKMIENEDKDFADDNAFLGNVESMLFQYKIIEAQSPALDVRVENPDLVGELK